MVVNGPFAAMTLGQAWQEMTPDWRGPRCVDMQDFPLLVKFIFPRDKLSVQVHPDDAYAAVHEAAAGGRGKTEMWHVVSAKSEAELLLGLKHGHDEERVLGCTGFARLWRISFKCIGCRRKTRSLCPPAFHTPSAAE